MDDIDLLDRRMNQVIGMIACLVNNKELCKIDIQKVHDALWAIEDMLLELRDLQEHFLDDRKILNQ